MSILNITTKKVPFRNWETWVRITEPKTPPKETKLPLIVLHGGPGMAHNYVRNISELAASTDRTIIHYDQIGCGNSTHLPEAPKDFWVPQLFVDEFNNLIKQLNISQYHLLGQSWGGMLGAEIAIRHPEGLRSLAICNSPASMELWIEGASDLRALLPIEVQNTLTLHESSETIHHPDYLAAADVFYQRHVCQIEPIAADFLESVQQMEADPTVYHTMNGPNEFHIVGSMKTWNIIDQLEKINVPTLVIAGEFDEATPKTWQPFVDHIKNVQSYIFPNSSHCVHLEKPEIFREFIANFLKHHDI